MGDMKQVLDPAVVKRVNELYEAELGPVPDPNNTAEWNAYLARLNGIGGNKSAIELTGALTTQQAIKDHIESSANSAQTRQRRGQALLAQYTKRDKNGQYVNKNAILIGGLAVAVPLIGFLLFASSSKPTPPVVQPGETLPVDPGITPVDQTGDIPAAPLPSDPAGSIDPADPVPGQDVPPPSSSANAPELDDGTAFSDPGAFDQPSLPVGAPSQPTTGFSPSAAPAPTLEVPAPVTQRDPSFTNSPLTFPTVPQQPTAVEQPSVTPISTTPVASTPPASDPGVGLNFGMGTPLPVDPGGVSVPQPSAPPQAAVVPPPVELPVRASAVYTRSGGINTGAPTGGSGAQAAAPAAAANTNRTATAYRVPPPPVQAPRVYTAPASARPGAPTVVGSPSRTSYPQQTSRASTSQPTARPAAQPATAAPATEGVAAAAGRAAQTASETVTGVVGDGTRPTAAAPVAAPTQAAQGTQVAQGTQAAQGNMVIYRRPAGASTSPNTAQSAGAQAPAAGTVIYSRSAAQVQQTAAAQSAPMNEAPAQAAGPKLPVAGTTIPAVLTGDVTTALGGAMPVIVRAADGGLWIGAATIDGTKRMQILFDRLVNPTTGTVSPIRAMAFAAGGKAGLDAKITNKAPGLVTDLLRAAISGVDRYVTTLASQKTTTVTPNGTTVQTDNSPTLGQTILANTSSVFRLPEVGSTFIPVGEASAGTRLFVVVDVQPQQSSGGLSSGAGSQP